MEKLKSAHKKAIAKAKEVHRKSVELYKNDRKKFMKVSVIILVLLLLAGWLWSRMPNEMSMREAGRIGEKKTYQLMIKIDNPRGAVGGFQRGDIILAAAENKEFSVAEQEGFLIVKMGLTEAQSNLLLTGKDDGRREMDPKKERKEPAKQEPIRRFYVDLEKMGIKPEEQRGRVISDKVFDWQEVVKEK